MSSDAFKLVQLAGGDYSIRSTAHGETMHPSGPAREARALYVDQLRLLQRMSRAQDQFVIWDIGLGAGANVLTVLEATRQIPRPLRVISFDNTLEPIAFALAHADQLAYFSDYRTAVAQLLAPLLPAGGSEDGRVGSCSGIAHSLSFNDGHRNIEWTLHVADFPEFISSAAGRGQPRPHAIIFDAYSPAKNPAMWTLPLFARLFELLDPDRPCALATYSRSTMLRVTLLLAGFFAGAGHATGEKEETTIAANTLELIDEPLDRKWLERARASTSAEPLHEPVYRQAPLTGKTLETLREHPQFPP